MSRKANGGVLKELLEKRYSVSERPRDHWCGMVAEFLGALFFSYFVAGSVVVPDNVLSEKGGADLQGQTLITGFVQGLGIAVLVALMSGLSGGHINPAVTLCLVVARAWPVLVGLCYIIAQLCGALCGAALFLASVGWSLGKTLGATVPAPFLSDGRAFLIEFMLTSLLLWTVLATAADEQNGHKQLAPLPIGFSVLIGVMVGKSLTGGSLNPARSFGSAVVSSTWESHWVYWIGPFLASIVVGVMYKLLFYSVNQGPNHTNDSNGKFISTLQREHPSENTIHDLESC